MNVTADELAGIVDLFGGLTREELDDALAELSFRHGERAESGAFAGEIDRALEGYQLVRIDTDRVGDPLLVPGPTAFPELPQDARDLPHILDVDGRRVDTGVASEAVEKRFREDVHNAVEAGDTARIETLIDASYELESWGDLDLGGLRERLDGAL